jgi:hypothetical protein
MSDDPFAEYGKQRSILEMIDELVLVCMMNMKDQPLRMVFNQHTFNFIALELAGKDWRDSRYQNYIKTGLIQYATPAGMIEIVEENRQK